MVTSELKDNVEIYLCDTKNMIDFGTIAERIIKSNTQIVLSATSEEINAIDIDGKSIRDFIYTFIESLVNVIQIVNVKLLYKRIYKRLIDNNFV